MPYTYIEHVSDIGIHAEGKDADEAFESGAEAMLGVMFELTTVKETIAITFGKDAPDMALLFIEVLNEVLSIQDRHSLALKRLETKEIKKTDSGYLFIGTAHGEEIDLFRHIVKTEVKAATYSGLLYKEIDGRHIFECVLDV